MAANAFEDAKNRLNQSSINVDTTTQLKLYGLYKQSSVGDVQGSRPGMLNLRGRAKWDAWSANKGMSKDEAQAAYVELAERLLAAG